MDCYQQSDVCHKVANRKLSRNLLLLAGLCIFRVLDRMTAQLGFAALEATDERLQMRAID